MINLLVKTITYTMVLLVIVAPSIFMARRIKRPATAKRFLIAALCAGAACGITAGGSDIVVRQCREAEATTSIESGSSNPVLIESNLPTCTDPGSAGFIFLTLGGVLIASVVKTTEMARW